MAKKKSAAELRWGDWKSSNVQEFAQTLRDTAAELDGVADEMTEKEIASMTVDGTTKPDAALKNIELFIESLRIAMIRHRRKNS